jgi:hypothetical protein
MNKNSARKERIRAMRRREEMIQKQRLEIEAQRKAQVQKITIFAAIFAFNVITLVGYYLL